jgi:hypothetical protein
VPAHFCKKLTYVSFEAHGLLHSSATDFQTHDQREGHTMKALQDLFSTDYGIMSVVVIVAMLVGLGAAYVVLRAKMAEGERSAGK